MKKDRIEKLKALLEAEPEDPFCLYGLAHEHEKVGDHETAIDYYRRTIRADPDELYAYYHMAKCQALLDDDTGAKETLEAGLERAQAQGDAKAIDEMQEALDELPS